MKQVTKTATIGVSCLMLLTFPVAAETIPVENDSFDEEVVYIDGIPVPQEMLLQEEALNAYDALYSRFEQDEDNNYILPDNYAGEYIDDDYNLVVQLTTDDYSEYEFLLDEFDCVVFKTVEYSRNELMELAEETRVSIVETENMNNIEYVTSCVSNQENKAKIDIYTNKPVEESAVFYSSDNLPLEIKYIYNEDRTSSSSMSEFRTPYSTNATTATLIGGKSIVEGKLGLTYLTMAVCGTYNGKNAILTCGHGLTKTLSVHCDNVEIGNVYYTKFDDNNYGDFGIITLNDNAVMTNQVKYQTGTVPITATTNTVPENTTCYNYGGASGFTQVKVREAKDVEYTGEGVTIKGLVAADIIYGQCLSGDSGSPYYTLSNGKWTFCGVHSGSNSLDAYFTPYKYIYSVFKVKTS